MCEICSKLTIKTPEGRKLTSFWCFYCWLWTNLSYCSGVSIVDFEYVNATWLENLLLFKYFTKRLSENLKVAKYASVFVSFSSASSLALVYLKFFFLSLLEFWKHESDPYLFDLLLDSLLRDRLQIFFLIFSELINF